MNTWQPKRREAGSILRIAGTIKNFIMGKLTKNEFMARVMDHMAHHYEPVGSYPPKRNFPHSGIGWKPNTPFNIRHFIKLLAGMHTHNIAEGLTDE